MNNPDATIEVVVPVVTPAMYCALGRVEVAGLWGEPRPEAHAWRVKKPVRSHGWQTTALPDQHSGGF